jgi:hypothetical protein
MNRRMIMAAMAVLSIVVLFFIWLRTGSTVIKIDLSRIDSINNTAVFIDGKRALSVNEKTKVFKSWNRPGKHTVLIRSAGFKDSTYTIRTWGSGTKVISPSLQEESASELLSTIDMGSDKQKLPVIKGGYYKTVWIGFQTKDETNGHVYPFFAYYDNRLAKWTPANYGGDSELEEGGVIPYPLIKEYSGE